MDCGHFMGRTHMSTRWLLDNLGVQCLTCNRVDNGRPEKFAEYIDRTYGKDMPTGSERLPNKSPTSPSRT